MPFLDVYFIPFTDKEIKFEKVELPPDKPFGDDDDDGKTTVDCEGLQYDCVRQW
jgi:hypothetical protein